jgi:hypothetical protein
VRADRLLVVTTPRRPAPLQVAPPRTYRLSDCSPALARGRSVARIWDEAALAVDPARGDPAAQARDLFHLSAAMWDAWAAYEPKASGYFDREKLRVGDVPAARDAAISYAAYRLLLWRASYRPDMAAAFAKLTATMRSVCFRTGFVGTQGDSPAALGNRIAAAAIAYGRRDGSLERQHYADPSYVPANEPLVVSQPGAAMHDAAFWQPLAFGHIVIQGGLSVPAEVQPFVASQWGRVRGFALTASKDGLPIDPGAPPLRDPSSAAYKRAALDVIRSSSRAGGAKVAGTPGHWNAIANGRQHGLSAAERLASDVKLYFALNGALHDAAIATWGAKRKYQSVRPISMIRELAFQGQSSDRSAPSYRPDGLLLVPGLVELVTRASSAPGQRHAALAGHVGDVAIRTASGWTLGTRWLPRAGAVTPPYPGWVSDESAFAQAAASVLTGPTIRQAANESELAAVAAGTETAADDLAGRKIGAKVGRQALALARRYFAGKR